MPSLGNRWSAVDLRWRGAGCAPAGGGVIAFARHPGFSSQSRSKTPAPIRVDFYIGSTSPYAHGALFCLGAGSGIPPAAAPSFRGVKKEKLHEVSRIEPSGQGISAEPCTTHGFGVGGTGRARTGICLFMRCADRQHGLCRIALQQLLS